MVKKIVFFNHKGGVSKTTSAFNIGWKLAQLGHKTLLVDADPQCNLSSLFLGNDFDSYYSNDATRWNNIMDGVKPVFAGTPNPIIALDCPQHNMNNNLFLLPGHMNLSEYDPQLTFAINAPITLTSMQNLPGSFNYLIDCISEKYEVEYAIIDLNPGLSTLNQVFFISSDAFIIPTNPDVFSEMAIRSLARILPQWMNWKRHNIHNFNSSTYPLPSNTPMFIGDFIQRFNIRRGVAAAPYQPLINTIKTTVKTVLAPALEQVSMLFSVEQYSQAHIPEDFCLSEIKDFQALGQKSQETGIPVFAIPDDKLGATGQIKKQLIASRDNFNTIYTQVANSIISILNNL